MLRPGIKNAQELACGVCLLNVDSRSRVSHRLPPHHFRGRAHPRQDPGHITPWPRGGGPIRSRGGTKKQRLPPGAMQGAGAGADQVLPLCGAGSLAFCLQPPLHARWHGGKGRPVRTCLHARGPVLGMLLTLWFQHYFRKKRSLQKSILKKYEPLTRYLSVSHLNFECGGQIQWFHCHPELFQSRMLCWVLSIPTVSDSVN